MLRPEWTTPDAMSNRREAGVSFLEMIVAVALVGVITAAAGPRIPMMLASYDLVDTTQQIALDLRLARERAITSNAKARVQFASGNWVVQHESPVGSGTYVTDGATQMLPTTITTDTAGTTPTFDSRGLAIQPYTITVTNNYGTSKTISVSATGRINVS